MVGRQKTEGRRKEKRRKCVVADRDPPELKRWN